MKDFDYNNHKSPVTDFQPRLDFVLEEDPRRFFIGRNCLGVRGSFIRVSSRGYFSLPLSLSLSLSPSLSVSLPWRSAVETEEALATDSHGKRGLENERLRRRKFVAESNRRRANGKSFLCAAGNLSRYRPRAIQ